MTWGDCFGLEFLSGFRLPPAVSWPMPVGALVWSIGFWLRKRVPGRLADTLSFTGQLVTLLGMPLLVLVDLTIGSMHEILYEPRWTLGPIEAWSRETLGLQDGPGCRTNPSGRPGVTFPAMLGILAGGLAVAAACLGAFLLVTLAAIGGAIIRNRLWPWLTRKAGSAAQPRPARPLVQGLRESRRRARRAKLRR